MRKTKLISIVAVSLIVLAILIFKFLVPKFKNNSNAAKETAAQEETLNAKAAPEAVHQIAITPKVRGTVVEFPVRDGTYKQKRMLLSRQG